MPNLELFELARQVLYAYQLEHADIRFIRHNENATFQVDTSDQRFLLRLHTPALHSFTGPQHGRLAVESELRWLNGLNRDTRLLIPRPVRTPAGAWTTAVGTEQRSVIAASLLVWQAGAPFDQTAPAAARHAAALGASLAHLHDYATHWIAPASFKRPVYGVEHTHTFARMLAPAQRLGIASVEESALVAATFAEIERIIEQQPRDGEHYGMIHGDLHAGNVLVDGAAVKLIDFSMCGLGPYVLDVGYCLAGLKPKLHSPFLGAYSQLRPIKVEAMRAVEAFAVQGRFGSYAFLLERAEEQEWLKRRLPQVVAAVCRRFLAGDSILEAL